MMLKRIIRGIAAGVILLFSLSAWSRSPSGSLLDGLAPGPDGKIDPLTVFSYQDNESILAGGAHAGQMQFTSVGNLTRWVLLLDHEYFARMD